MGDNFKDWLGLEEFTQSLNEINWGNVGAGIMNQAGKFANNFMQNVASGQVNPYGNRKWDRDTSALAKAWGVDPETVQRMMGNGDSRSNGGTEGLSGPQQAQQISSALAQAVIKVSEQNPSFKINDISDAIRAYNALYPSSPVPANWLSSPVGQQATQIFHGQLRAIQQQQAQRSQDRSRHGYVQQDSLEQMRQTDPGRYMVFSLTNSHPGLSKLRNQITALEKSNPGSAKGQQMKQQYDNAIQSVFSNPKTRQMIQQMRMMQGKPEFQQLQNDFAKEIYHATNQAVDRTLNPSNWSQGKL